MKIMDRKWVSPLVLLALVAAVLLLRGNGHPDRVPALQIALLDGGRIDLGQADGKVRLVNFWSTSCGPCIKGMPGLADAHRRHAARGFEVVAVAMSYDAPSHVQDFAQREKLPFRVGFDPVGELDHGFGGIRATPTSFLVDRDGRIVKRIIGNPDHRQLDALIDTLLPPAS
jgi:peroxiredoxin